jgi:hypothetical protein
VAERPSVYRFQVEGLEEPKTALGRDVHPFDETFEIEGEHPAHALEKLLHEIEWGILDSYRPWTISYLGEGAADG